MMKSLPRRSVVRRPSLRRSNPAIAFACEPVERRLLLASVSGTVFHDVNANGVQDLSEAYQSGFRIYADLNHNGQFDADEPSAVSNNFGQWKIDGLPAGKYLIREEPRAGFTKFPLTPSAGFYHVVLPTDDSSVENLEFGNARFASASGRVFFDTWGNGKEDGPDTGLAGITVFIDANDNGVLDPGEVSKQTNADGEFRIEYIRPGFTRVRIIVPPDLHAELFRLPAEAKLVVDLAAQTLTLPDGRAIEFPVDPFAKHCLLNGVDELGYILQHEAAITEYEQRRA